MQNSSGFETGDVRSSAVRESEVYIEDPGVGLNRFYSKETSPEVFDSEVRGSIRWRGGVKGR